LFADPANFSFGTVCETKEEEEEGEGGGRVMIVFSLSMTVLDE
jgi:hypothetical protein